MSDVAAIVHDILSFLLAALALITLAAGSALYARDATFAARINAFANSAQAQAATLVDELAR